MNLLKEERETIINFTEADTMATVYTRSRSIMSRMDKLCKKNALATVEKETEYDRTYKVPIACVLPRNIPMQTDELRAKRAVLAKVLVANKNK